jgi:hypothetical protein
MMRALPDVRKREQWQGRVAFKISDAFPKVEAL